MYRSITFALAQMHCLQLGINDNLMRTIHFDIYPYIPVVTLHAKLSVSFEVVVHSTKSTLT